MLAIELGNPAKRFLRNCESELYQRLMDRIRILAANPFPQDVKRVVGKKEKVFRVRVGDYRIVFKKTDDEIYIVTIGHKSDIYKFLK